MVVMATYSSHRFIMGKEEIDHFFFLIVDICIFFYRNVYSSSIVRPLSIHCLSTFSNDTSSEAKKPIIFIFHI